MIDYTIDEALDSKRADAIYVSTDSDEIAAHAENRGIKVIRRSEDLGGEVPILEVYRHALGNIANNTQIDVLVGLQPDHPDRMVSVDETIAIFEREGVDRVMSEEPDGTKSGAHYVLSRYFVENGESRKDITIIDDCNNIHYPEDLARAAARLKARRMGGDGGGAGGGGVGDARRAPRLEAALVGYGDKRAQRAPDEEATREHAHRHNHHHEVYHGATMAAVLRDHTRGHLDKG